MSRSLYARLHRRFGARPSGPDLVYRARAKISSIIQRFRLDESFTIRYHKRRGRLPRVAVVGGGFGGLSAGYQLRNAAEVTVLEASLRLGGKVWSRSDFTPGRTIEFGGELIGYNHALWLGFAEMFGLGLSMITTDSDFDSLGLDSPLRLDGKTLSQSQARAVYDEMTRAFGTLNRDAKPLLAHVYEPWKVRNAEGFDRKPLASILDGLKYSSRFTRAALEAQFALNNGAPTENQSYLANLALVAGAAVEEERSRRPYLMSYWEHTEVARCARGNMALAEALTSRISEKSENRVLCGVPVTEISISPGGVVVGFGGKSTENYDYVVLAVPPSAWKYIKVEPEIPPDYAMGLGTVLKYFSNVDSRFWLDRSLSPSATDSVLGMTWEGTDNQIGSESFELSLFAGGPAARKAIKREGGREYYDKRLNAVYPGYTEHVQKTCFVDWEQHPYIMGGYSCPGLGQVTTAGKYLNKPIHGRLFFAGEHVCLPFFGYMEGALESGVMAAQRILRRISLHNDGSQ